MMHIIRNSLEQLKKELTNLDNLEDPTRNNRDGGIELRKLNTIH